MQSESTMQQQQQQQPRRAQAPGPSCVAQLDALIGELGRGGGAGEGAGAAAGGGKPTAGSAAAGGASAVQQLESFILELERSCPQALNALTKASSAAASAPAKLPVAAAAAAAGAGEINPTTRQKEQKKKEKKAEAKPAAAAAAEEPELDPSKLDIRVGLVTRCWAHPESDKLYCEEIDVGEGAARSIASGLRAFYPCAGDIQGRLVLVLANLKERPLAGFKSQGMVLCASNADHSVVQLVDAPAGARPGDRVLFAGFHGEPATPAQVAKKKIFEKLAPELRTDALGVAHWGGVPLTVGGELCRCPAVPNAHVS
jgi:aminoacyl tRNA synthase complex-interacting multifunctional protein 1